MCQRKNHGEIKLWLKKISKKKSEGKDWTITCFRYDSYTKVLNSLTYENFFNMSSIFMKIRETCNVLNQSIIHSPPERWRSLILIRPFIFRKLIVINVPMLLMEPTIASPLFARWIVNIKQWMRICWRCQRINHKYQQE